MGLSIASNYEFPLSLTQDRTAIFGMTDSGKTHTAVVLVESAIKQGVVPIILDPLGVWWGLQLNKAGSGPGLAIPLIGTATDHRDYPLTQQMGTILAQWAKTPGNPGLIIEMLHFNDSERRHFVRELALGLMKSRTPVFLVLDEADIFAPQQSKGDELMMSAMNGLSRRGRTLGIGMLSISQRPAVLNKNITTQCSTIITHKLTAPQDTKALDEWIRSAVDIGDRNDFLKRVRRLQRGEAYVLSSTLEPSLALVQVRDRSTFNSSGTPDLKTATQKLFAPQVGLGSLLSGLDRFIEKAKGDDVAWLKARVKELELAAKKGPATTVVDRPVPVKEYVDRVSRQEFGQILEQLAQVKVKVEGIETTARGLMGKFDEPLPAQALPPAKPIPAVKHPTPIQGLETEPIGALVELEKMKIAILKALMSWRVLGIEPLEQRDLATEAGSSHTSSSFESHLRGLRDRGLVDYVGSKGVKITDAGAALFPTPPAAATLGEYRDRWYRKLNDAQGRIIRQLLDLHPLEVEYAELATMVGNSPTSSTYEGNLSELRRLKLVTYKGRGAVSLTDTLFPFR